MTEKELHKLRRQDFLQLLLTQGTEMAELQRRLDETTEALQQMEAMGDRLKAKLNEKDELIEKLKGRLDQKDAAISEMESEMESARINRETELEEAEAAVAAELQGRLDETSEAREQAEAMGERLKAKLDEKDASIERLKGKLNEKDALIEKLKGRLDKKDATINELETEVAAARENRETGLEEIVAALQRGGIRDIYERDQRTIERSSRSPERTREPVTNSGTVEETPVDDTPEPAWKQRFSELWSHPDSAAEQPVPNGKPEPAPVAQTQPAPAVQPISAEPKPVPATSRSTQQTGNAAQPKVFSKLLYRRSAES